MQTILKRKAPTRLTLNDHMSPEYTLQIDPNVKGSPSEQMMPLVVACTVNVLYKNPLFKNLSPHFGGIHKIQVASKLRTLKATLAFGIRFSILCWVEVVSLWLLLCTGNMNLGGNRVLVLAIGATPPPARGQNLIRFCIVALAHPLPSLPMPRGKNELEPDTNSFLPRGRRRQGCGWGQGRIDTAAILAQGTCYV